MYTLCFVRINKANKWDGPHKYLLGVCVCGKKMQRNVEQEVGEPHKNSMQSILQMDLVIMLVSVLV